MVVDNDPASPRFEGGMHPPKTAKCSCNGCLHEIRQIDHVMGQQLLVRIARYGLRPHLQQGGCTSRDARVEDNDAPLKFLPALGREHDRRDANATMLQELNQIESAERDLALVLLADQFAADVDLNTATLLSERRGGRVLSHEFF